MRRFVLPAAVLLALTLAGCSDGGSSGGSGDGDDGSTGPLKADETRTPAGCTFPEIAGKQDISVELLAQRRQEVVPGLWLTSGTTKAGSPTVRLDVERTDQGCHGVATVTGGAGQDVTVLDVRLSVGKPVADQVPNRASLPVRLHLTD